MGPTCTVCLGVITVIVKFATYYTQTLLQDTLEGNQIIKIILHTWLYRLYNNSPVCQKYFYHKKNPFCHFNYIMGRPKQALTSDRHRSSTSVLALSHAMFPRMISTAWREARVPLPTSEFSMKNDFTWRRGREGREDNA